MKEGLISRCTRTTNLDVYPLRRDGSSVLDNAQVLCRRCQAATKGYEPPSRKPPGFDHATKEAALQRAGHQCECTRIGACHAGGLTSASERAPIQNGRQGR